MFSNCCIIIQPVKQLILVFYCRAYAKNLPTVLLLQGVVFQNSGYQHSINKPRFGYLLLRQLPHYKKSVFFPLFVLISTLFTPQFWGIIFQTFGLLMESIFSSSDSKELNEMWSYSSLIVVLLMDCITRNMQIFWNTFDFKFFLGFISTHVQSQCFVFCFGGGYLDDHSQYLNPVTTVISKLLLPSFVNDISLKV